MILVRRSTFTCVGTLWLIPNIHFTSFCFAYCFSTPLLYSQFAYYRGRDEVVYFFAKFSEDFPGISKRPSS